jgi:ribosomal RNA assembly protein
MRFVKIPQERVGVLVGTNGDIKKRLEEKTGTTIDIDSESGDVTIDDSKAEDPLLVLKCADMVKAMGRGFSPEKAMNLLSDDIYFTLLDIRDYVGKEKKHIRRIRGRVIGQRGKARRLIEELTGVYMSVYGNTIGVIGGRVEMGVAVYAIELLLSGSEHATVYGFLEKKRREIEIAKMGF